MNRRRDWQNNDLVAMATAAPGLHQKCIFLSYGQEITLLDIYVIFTFFVMTDFETFGTAKMSQT